jgi:hypothetical protein
MRLSRARRTAVASEKNAVAARTQAELNAQLARSAGGRWPVGTVQSLIVQANEKLQGPELYEIRLGSACQVALQTSTAWRGRPT